MRIFQAKSVERKPKPDIAVVSRKQVRQQTAAEHIRAETDFINQLHREKGLQVEALEKDLEDFTQQAFTKRLSIQQDIDRLLLAKKEAQQPLDALAAELHVQQLALNQQQGEMKQREADLEQKLTAIEQRELLIQKREKEALTRNTKLSRVHTDYTARMVRLSAKEASVKRSITEQNRTSQIARRELDKIRGTLNAQIKANKIIADSHAKRQTELDNYHAQLQDGRAILDRAWKELRTKQQP